MKRLTAAIVLLAASAAVPAEGVMEGNWHCRMYGKLYAWALEDLHDIERREPFNHVRQDGPVWDTLVFPIALVNEFHAIIDSGVEPSKRQHISDLLSCGRIHGCEWAAGPDDVPGSLPLGNCPR